MENLIAMLCPPGDGVYTVNTAKQKKEKLQRSLYPNKHDISAAWKKNLQDNLKGAELVMLGICSDCGGGILRGANWGPLFIREQLKDVRSDFLDLGDIRVIPHLLHDKYLNSETLENCRLALYNDRTSTLPVSPLSITAEVMKEIFKKDPHKRVISLGGDHSVSYPLTQEFFEHKKKQGIKTALIHFDAHTDLLKERLGIDICFASWTSHVIPKLEKPAHLIQIGIRSSGKDRNYWEESFDGIKQYWASEVLSRGPLDIAKEIVENLTKESIQELYISFDIDALDVAYASATGTPEPNGLSPQDAVTIISTLGKKFKITGADLVEVAPFLKTEGASNEGTLKTLSSAETIAKALIKEMACANI